MKKILFYIYSLNKGGAERILLAIAETLKNKYEIVILTDTQEEREYPLPKQIKRVVIGSGAGAVWRLKQIRRYCKEENPDIVIAFMISSAIRCVIANLFSGRKILTAVRSNPFDEYGSRCKKLYLNAIFALSKGIICQTQFQKEYFYPFNRRKCEVIFNPVTIEFAEYQTKKSSGERVVCVGRLYDYKNHAMLIRAFSNIVDEYPDATLTIYGDGPYREETQKLIDTLKVKDKVNLPGDVDEVAKHIGGAALFVLPSNTEGMPNALMEAMALQIPCIATDCPCGGARTLIRDGVNGYLCKVNDVDELTEKMKLLLSNKTLAEKIGKEAGKITQQYSIDKISRQWSECIERKWN